MTVAGFALPRIPPFTQIVRMGGVGIILILVSALVWIGLFRPRAHDAADTGLAAQQTALAHYVARDVEYKVAERTSLLIHMASRLPIALLDKPAQMRRWLGEQQQQQPLFSQGLFVTDTQGRAVADYPQHPAHPQARYDDDYLRGALTGALTIGRPVTGGIGNEPVLPMAAAVKDASGKVRAVLVGMTALHAPGFLTLNPQNSDDEDTDLQLISPQDRLVVASTQATQVLQPTPAPGADGLLDRAMQGFRGSDVRTNPQGIEESSAIAPVSSIGWFVLARHADVPARHSVNIARVAAIATVVIFAITGLLLLKRRGALAAPAMSPYHDPLTGLANAALLADRLSQALARSHRSRARVGLLHINLDQFSSINERLGFEAGNAALTEIARRLAAIVRETDTLARIEGDAFVVMLGELEGGYESAEIAACAVAAKCLDAVAPVLVIGTTPIQLGASVGIALSKGSTTAEDLQNTAARAMYQAKQVGGDRYFVASPAAIPAKPAMANA